MKAEAWFLRRAINLTRTIECIERHQHIHTHFACHAQGRQAVAFVERNGWLPPKCERVYSFDEIPKLCDDSLRGDADCFPISSLDGARP